MTPDCQNSKKYQRWKNCSCSFPLKSSDNYQVLRISMRNLWHLSFSLTTLQSCSYFLSSKKIFSWPWNPLFQFEIFLYLHMLEIPPYWTSCIESILLFNAWPVVHNQLFQRRLDTHPNYFLQTIMNETNTSIRWWLSFLLCKSTEGRTGCKLFLLATWPQIL